MPGVLYTFLLLGNSARRHVCVFNFGGCGLLRRRPDVHKRLMLLATISILVGRDLRGCHSHSLQGYGPLAFFGLTDALVVFVVFYDLVTLRRIHRVSALAGLLIIASHPLRMMLGGTHAWLSFATRLTSAHWVT